MSKGTQEYRLTSMAVDRRQENPGHTDGQNLTGSAMPPCFSTKRLWQITNPTIQNPIAEFPANAQFATITKGFQIGADPHLSGFPISRLFFPPRPVFLPIRFGTISFFGFPFLKLSMLFSLHNMTFLARTEIYFFQLFKIQIESLQQWV